MKARIGCKRTVHAECNAIINAAKLGHKTDGGILVTTKMPCYNCAMQIINSGIVCVEYLEDYRIRDGIDLLIETGIEVIKIEI